jgi:integrase
MLTEIQCKNAKCPEGKAYIRLHHGGGLYLQVSAGGSKRWFWKYRFGGKERRVSLGSYPAVSLKQAGLNRDAERLKKEAGTDPGRARTAARKAVDGHSFEAVAWRWLAEHRQTVGISHATRCERWLRNDVLPFIGSVHIEEITWPLLRQNVLNRLAFGTATRSATVETAHRVKQMVGQIMRHAIDEEYKVTDVTAHMHGRLPVPASKNLAAVLEPKPLGEMLLAMRGYQGGPVVKTALQLAPLLAVRPFNLRTMTWAELDLEAALWTIPSEKMKLPQHKKQTHEDFVVPLPTQAVALIRELEPLTRRRSAYVFPGERGASRPISENTMNQALKTLGYSGEVQTIHGFRATFRTMGAERLDEQDRLLEACLAHAPTDPLGRSYNRAGFLDQRRALMQRWADYLDSLVEKAQSETPAPEVSDAPPEVFSEVSSGANHGHR